ncbi:sugar transporter [Colletotrichum cuscutae]|uniref:Sugar transporter n=1 Tax=Colletotrichum cuscutae TaxID=1209917 RepID=A0AAI9V049_9PEZI|nr:sugar transporter [Colletotrichum cuscutae]
MSGRTGPTNYKLESSDESILVASTFGAQRADNKIQACGTVVASTFPSFPGHCKNPRESDAKQFPTLSEDATLQGWMVAVLTLGAMVGALVNGPIADALSRRWTILLANIIFLIGSIIQAASINIPMIFIGRFIAGLSIGQLSMVVPLYLSELAPPNLRGSLVALQQLGITVGIMIAFWPDYGTQHIGGTGDGQSPAAWRLPLALQYREEDALATLVRIWRVPPTDARLKLELTEIKVAARFDIETTAKLFPGVTSRLKLTLERYKSLFVVRHLNRRLVIACLLQLIQQFTGINAIIYYSPTIFRNIGLSDNSVDLLATGVVGVINFFSTIPAIMFMDRWGRKKVLLIGGVGMGVSQLIVGTLYAVYQDSWGSNKSAGWAAAFFIWAYIANFAFSIGCVNWIVPSEIFPPGVRSQAVGLAIGTNWLSNFIVALITPRMLEAITFGTFYFFLAFCVILIVWVYFFVPETKGVRVEEMDKLFGGNQGEADMTRMAIIRQQLGLIQGDELTKEVSMGVSEVEKA